MISRPASDQKKKNRKSNENESNYKSTRQQKWEEREGKNNEQIYTQTDIFVLNWKTDKKTNALVHLFSIKNLFLSLSLSSCVQEDEELFCTDRW